MKRYLVLCLLFFSVLGSVTAKETEKELVVAFSPASLGFNPLHTFTSTEAQIYTALYEGLVTYNPYSLEPIPAAARTWEISSDKKTYTFYIRQNARYWDGTAVRAQNFKDTWLRLLDPAEDAEYSFLFDIVKGAREYRLGLTDNADGLGIRVISDKILEVELVEPSPHLLKILCHHSFVPIHPGMLYRRDWSAVNSIPGNGPFYLYRRTEGEILLLKNQLYWDAGRIALSGIKILFLEDPEDITARFNEGEIHWAADGLIFSMVRNNESISANPLFATSYFFFSCRNPVLNDPKVRRGIALLFPWQEIRSRTYNFIPTETLVPKIPLYPDVPGLGQNVEEGLKLLKEAGYEGGAGLPDLTIAIPDNAESRRIAELMAEAIKKNLAVEVLVVSTPYGQYYDELKKDTYSLGTITWIGDFADPLTFLQMWTADSNLNDAGYGDSSFDNLVEQSMSLSGEARYKKMAEAEEKILREALVLPVSNSPAFNLIDLNRIDGWYTNPLDIHPFRFISFKVPRVGPGIAKHGNPEIDSLINYIPSSPAP